MSEPVKNTDSRWALVYRERGRLDEEVLRWMQEFYGDDVNLASFGVKIGLPYSAFTLIRGLSLTVGDKDRILEGKS